MTNASHCQLCTCGPTVAVRRWKTRPKKTSCSLKQLLLLSTTTSTAGSRRWRSPLLLKTPPHTATENMRAAPFRAGLQHASSLPPTPVLPPSLCPALARPACTHPTSANMVVTRCTMAGLRTPSAHFCAVLSQHAPWSGAWCQIKRAGRGQKRRWCDLFNLHESGQLEAGAQGSGSVETCALMTALTPLLAVRRLSATCTRCFDQSLHAEALLYGERKSPGKQALCYIRLNPHTPASTEAVTAASNTALLAEARVGPRTSRHPLLMWHARCAKRARKRGARDAAERTI